MHEIKPNMAYSTRVNVRVEGVGGMNIGSLNPNP